MKRDIYQEVTNQIIATMEQGRLPWEKPWDCSGGVAGVPMNATTGRAYRGMNTMILWQAGWLLKTDDLRFLTFKQAKAAGGSIIKGSKGFKICFFKKLDLKRENEETGQEERFQIPMLKDFTVFHVSQTQGCKNLKEPAEIDIERMPEDAGELADAIGCYVVNRGDRAFYMPSRDMVQMPPADTFKSDDHYRATLYHEITHWTGAAHRMARKFGARKGDKDYAREELIAELGSAFMCAEFGIEHTTRHAAYLQSWLGALKDDKRLIFQAASSAQKAVDWIRAAALEDIAQAA